MREFRLKNPHTMREEAFNSLTQEEQDRLILTWLIVLKLPQAPVSALETAHRILRDAADPELARKLERLRGARI